MRCADVHETLRCCQRRSLQSNTWLPCWLHRRLQVTLFQGPRTKSAPLRTQKKFGDPRSKDRSQTKLRPMQNSPEQEPQIQLPRFATRTVGFLFVGFPNESKRMTGGPGLHLDKSRCGMVGPTGQDLSVPAHEHGLPELQHWTC